MVGRNHGGPSGISWTGLSRLGLLMPDCEWAALVDQHWTLRDIEYLLTEAADTLRRLPFPQRGAPEWLQACWPDVVHDWMAYAWTPAQAKRAPPTPDAIQRLDQVLSWLHWLTRDQRMIVWARAQGWTWRKIMELDDEERHGRGRQERQLRTICGDGHARILAELNDLPRRAVGFEYEQASVG